MFDDLFDVFAFYTYNKDFLLSYLPTYLYSPSLISQQTRKKHVEIWTEKSIFFNKSEFNLYWEDAKDGQPAINI